MHTGCPQGVHSVFAVWRGVAQQGRELLSVPSIRPGSLGLPTTSSPGCRVVDIGLGQRGELVQLGQSPTANSKRCVLFGNDFFVFLMKIRKN